MHIIARPAIEAAKRNHPNAAIWLDVWWNIAGKSKWSRLADVRVNYPHTDEVGSCLIFNVCGNHYRLICGMSYANERSGGTLFVKHFLTHAEYDKKRWCKDCEFPEKPK